jgi:2-polyprenyl-3-methyl-5-hydroxy-6-metoxy-1,4-benzoquinol methylase
MTEVIQCPACGAEKSSLFDRREVLGMMLCNRMCRHCGLVYLSPRMEDQELERFYSRGYRTLNDGSEQPTDENLADQQARAQHVVRTARAIAPAVQRHLDIGCSTGILMAQVREVFACETAGVEPGIEHRSIASAKGLKTYASIEEALAEQQRRFDLVTLSHVLEHLADPVSELTRIRTQMLSSAGHILVEVPNLYGHACFEPAHLFSFSMKTLHDSLRLAGFEPVYTRLHGVPRSEWRPRYLLVMARPQEMSRNRRPARAWGGVRAAAIRRQWGLRNSRGILQFAGAVGRRLRGAR